MGVKNRGMLTIGIVCILVALLLAFVLVATANANQPAYEAGSEHITTTSQLGRLVIH